MSPPADAAEFWRPAANPWAIALMVTIAAFMEVLDSTIVNVALPHIGGSMSASNDESTWVLTSYLVANGIVLMISGFFTRLLGRKRYFLICIVMFTVFSFLCGAAESLPQMIIFRLLQGFFGGGLQPCQQSIILDSFPRENRAAAFAVTAMATIVAPVLGPVIGGVITDNYSWRWIFFINIPAGIVAFFGVTALVEDPPWVTLAAKVRPSMDYIGLGFIVLALGCFQVMLDRGENADWFSSGTITLLAVLSAIGFVGAVTWLLCARDPIVNLRVMQDRNFALGCLMIAAMAMCLYSSSVLLPQLSQQQLGYTATWAGLLLAPGAVALILLIVLVGRVMPYVQTRYIIAFGFLFLSFAFLYSSRLTPDIDFFDLAKDRVLQTMGLGFLFVPISSIAYLSLPKELNSDAAALYTMCRNVAGSIGISVASALVTTRDQVRMATLGSHLSPLSQPYAQTLSAISRTLQASGSTMAAAEQSAFAMLHQTLQKQAEILAYSDVFVVCAAISIIVLPFSFLLSPAKSGQAGTGSH
ncbi:DHA2 family efflux MFS transporter permease subunit [Lichenicoccus sp.]|uniref:DHA2 family efflux MFS transporter permease subunit n=1 Tax=Lichenicoccus sp. TaxID=2781899 RepID=UPI003D125788